MDVKTSPRDFTHEGILQAETLMDKRIVVAIDGWEVDSMFPHG